MSCTECRTLLGTWKWGQKNGILESKNNEMLYVLLQAQWRFGANQLTNDAVNNII